MKTRLLAILLAVGAVAFAQSAGQFPITLTVKSPVGGGELPAFKVDIKNASGNWQETSFTVVQELSQGNTETVSRLLISVPTAGTYTLRTENEFSSVGRAP